MSFYERQAAARRQTRWLVVAFAAAIALTVGALTVFILALVGGNDGRTVAELVAGEPALVTSIALTWLVIIMGSSVYRGLSLRDGGGAVARLLGGTRIDRTTGDPDLRRLRNVVEEMAIASGVPVPEVYVLDGEQGINAFAAGHSPANAAVAVTRGALTTLTREELQGVIAHEFSHILNGDMRLNIRLIGWLFGLMVVALMGRTLLRLAPDSRKGAAFVVTIGLGLFVLGFLGRGLGRVIQASVARERERLADASAVQFTRNPSGLKGALLKIAATPVWGPARDGAGDEVAHMLFVPGLRGTARDPSAAGGTDRRARPVVPSGAARDGRRGISPRLGAAVRRARAPEAGAMARHPGAAQRLERLLLPVVAAEVADQVGNPGTAQVALAHELRLALPAGFARLVRFAAAGPRPDARDTVVRDAGHRRAARRDRRRAGRSVAAAMDAARPVAAALPPLLRLPAVCGLFTPLRRLPREARVSLVGLIGRLAAVDREVDVFEFCLQRLVFNSLVDQLEARDGHGDGALATPSIRSACCSRCCAARGVAAGRPGADVARQAPTTPASRTSCPARGAPISRCRQTGRGACGRH